MIIKENIGYKIYMPCLHRIFFYDYWWSRRPRTPQVQRPCRHSDTVLLPRKTPKPVYSSPGMQTIRTDITGTFVFSYFSDSDSNTDSVNYVRYDMVDIDNQPVRLLVSARAYQPANSVFLSQQTSISRVYQPRNQPANMPKVNTY